MVVTVFGISKRKLKPRSRLPRADPKRGRQTEQRGQHRQNVDDMAGPAPDTFAKQRIEDRAQRQRQPLCYRQRAPATAPPPHRSPRVQTPVEDRGGHGQTPCPHLILGRAIKRRPVGAHAVLDDRPAKGRVEMAPAVR